MTGKSIETDEKPCPLTVSDWMAFLAAESQTIHGYKHLVVVMLLALSSMLLVAYMDGVTYIATRFESSGDYIQLIFAVVYWGILAIFYRKFPVKSFVNMFKEEDKNPEIIKEIISGKLTDPDKIRKRWENRETPVNAEKLLKICEKQIETRWKIVKFLKLAKYSFIGNFKAIKENIQFDTLDKSEIEKFINACEDRRVRVKTKIARLIVFDVVAMTVIASFAHETVSLPVYVCLLILLFICLIFLFAMLAHYRTQVHAWTVFKEDAILRKHPTEERAS